MHLWALSSVLLAVAAITFGNLALEDAKSSSLKTALEAVNRRQRDLASGKQFFGLGSYREDADDLSFLGQGGDPQTGDGQPENIGYGFQKSRSHHGFGESQAMNDEIENEERKMFENLAVGYLKDEFQKIDSANNQYYKVPVEAKRSVFRERELPERYSSVQGKVRGGFRKRATLGAFVPTSFRERNYKGETNEEKRRRIMKSINRRMSQELEDPALEDDEEYAQLVQSLWERYHETDPNIANIENLSESDVDALLNYLEENGPSGKLVEGGPAGMKRGSNADSSGAGYDFSDLLIQKRGKQMLDQDDAAASNAFLYSLKFVAPEYNREAVEQMRDMEGMDTSGENDADIFRLGLKASEDPDRRDGEEWHSPSRSEQDTEEYGQDVPPNYMSHVDQAQDHFYHHGSVRKRKRFLIAKRSPSFSNYGKDAFEFGKIRKKKSAQRETHTTDPKVASELSHIFETPSNENTNKLTPQIIGNHVVTKQKMTTTTTPAPKTNLTEIEMTVIVNGNQNASSVEQSHINEEMEPPVAMSRLEAPIEIKKKSIDWTDYFGLDRRRKKTGTSLQFEGGHGKVSGDSWLMNQYFKSVAAAGDRQRPLSLRNKKEVHLGTQPFDTRLYDENNLHAHPRIFKSKKDYSPEVDEDRIEKMDSKLRNIEDVIINEAVKYTGAHEGSTDSKEVQEVKDKVISRLAAAYNLEKMRKALSEFKSSLMAQKASKYNPENQGSHMEGEEKRSGPSKSSHSEKTTYEKNMNQAYSNDASGLTGPQVENMSEGYMGGLRNLQKERYGNECPIMGNVLKKCRDVELAVGHPDYDFLSLCSLHQICFVCGPQVDSDSVNACDGMLLEKAEESCSGDSSCEKSALRWVMALKRHQFEDILEGATNCAEDFCTSQPALHLER